MNRISVLAAGAALAITAAIANSVCAAAVVLWPDGSIRLANTWAHGLDLQVIKAASSLTPGSFLLGLVVLAVIAFMAGALFAFAYNLMAGHRLAA